jgi:hypothetical protein
MQGNDGQVLTAKSQRTARRQFWPGQPQVLFDHLNCRRPLLRFADAQGAGAHCRFGAQRLTHARIYDTLDDTLRKHP